MECLFGQTLVAEILTSPRLNYQWPNGQVVMSDSNLLLLTNTVTQFPSTGWFIDNVGVRQSAFSSPGDWISQPIELNGLDSFNMGIVEIEGKVDDNSTVTGSILDATTEEPIIGFESLDFPINLAGIDSENSFCN